MRSRPSPRRAEKGPAFPCKRALSARFADLLAGRMPEEKTPDEIIDESPLFEWATDDDGGVTSVVFVPRRDEDGDE